VHSGSFAPAFTLSFHDSERSRKPPNAHSLGRYGQVKKKNKIANIMDINELKEHLVKPISLKAKNRKLKKIHKATV